MRSTTSQKNSSLKKKKDAWFDGTHYTKTQPFATFLTCRGKIVPNSLNLLKKEIRKLIKQPAHATALEIGPGLAPVLSYFPFREAYYLEQSPAIANQLAKQNLVKKKNTKTISHFIVGDVQRLPFSKQTRFDLVVMNEILTHVQPAKRVKVLKHVISYSNALLLVERPQPTYTKFLHSLYPEMRTQQSPAELRAIYSAYTPFNSLLRMLKSEGWNVSTQNVTAGENYCILSAKRKK